MHVFEICREDEAKRDERGFVALGPVGQRVGNRSSFDVRNYGFKRLSDLVAAIRAAAA